MQIDPGAGSILLVHIAHAPGPRPELRVKGFNYYQVDAPCAKCRAPHRRTMLSSPEMIDTVILQKRYLCPPCERASWKRPVTVA